MDHRLKIMLKELGDAINSSLSDSDQIAEVINRIKEDGYDIFLVLEATIGFNRSGEEEEDGEQIQTSPVEYGNARRPADFAMTSQDRKFLRSLRIRADEDS